MRKKLQHTDAEALQMLQQGKEEGLNHFFGSYYNYILYFANELLQDRQLSEEVTADVFMKLWEFRERLASDSLIKAWLVRSVRNKAIDHLRKTKRLVLSEKGVAANIGTEESLLPKLIATETLTQLHHILALLTPKQQRVFRLLYVQNKNYQEVAQELGVSAVTVRGIKMRVLQSLKEKLNYTPLLLLFFF